jgi:hypothetical protein
MAAFRRIVLLSSLSLFAWNLAFAELGDRVAPSVKNPAIGYYTQPARDSVAELDSRLAEGKAQLRFENVAGYLRSVLAALQVPVESQVAVFSRTSFQAAIINPKNPRTLFFNDAVAVGWMHGGFIELAAQDPQLGINFYTLKQEPQEHPRFERQSSCVSCHVSDASLGVPGMMARSTYTDPDGMPRLILGAYLTDHRSPLEERWGGWYVTGKAGGARHMGNALLTDPDHPESMITPATLNLASLKSKFDTSEYLSPYSDIAALLVFNHQMHMINLITRVGWEARLAAAEHRDARALLREASTEFVDYLLFIDEAPLPGKIQGNSGFTEKFAALGPRDRKGRSLRDLDLHGRLMRYPCSYMIYSPAFDALPADAKEAIYHRLWEVLSGREKGARYAHLSPSDRQAIVSILRDTRAGLPNYFQPVTP